MGRMLDSLKQVNGERNVAPEAKSAALPAHDAASAATVPLPPPTSDPIGEAQDYPFIEVGAPGKKIEASPIVLAAAPPGLVKPTPRALAESPTKAPTCPTLVPKLSEPQPLGVRFQSWPGQGRPPSVAREIIAYHQPEHPVSKQYAALFAALVDGFAAGEGRVLVAVGAAPQVGATTVLLNLAFAGCAAGAEHLAIVEVNARPSLARRLGLGPVAGLAEVLAGSAALEKVVVETAHPRLHAVAAGIKPRPCTPEALRWVLGWLRERYEVILVDGPDLSEPQALAPMLETADALYLVLPQHENESPKLANWTQTIARLGGRLRGLIHTHFETA